MTTILFVSNRETLARYTPYFVGALYAIYITFETPLSGMSMNPARTFGSAIHASYWHGLWIYFIAPTLGMLAAAEVFLRARGVSLPTAQSSTTPTTSAAYSTTDIERRKPTTNRPCLNLEPSEWRSHPKKYKEAQYEHHGKRFFSAVI
jgi:hypothetical protein